MSLKGLILIIKNEVLESGNKKRLLRDYVLFSIASALKLKRQTD